MDNFTERVDEFYGCVKELVRWINEENKEFPHAERLLECGTGICGSFRAAMSTSGLTGKSFEEVVAKADEFIGLMELMVRTGILTEIQSRPLLSECGALKARAEDLLSGDRKEI